VATTSALQAGPPPTKELKIYGKFIAIKHICKVSIITELFINTICDKIPFEDKFNLVAFYLFKSAFPALESIGRQGIIGSERVGIDEGRIFCLRLESYHVVYLMSEVLHD
jgi:hypothetical protein